MAWTHLQSFTPTALPRAGWFESRHQVTDGKDVRTEFAKWDHSPSAPERAAAVTALLNRLNNPPPPNTTTRAMKSALVAIRDSAQTGAQKLSALSNYIDTLVGAD